MSTTTHNDVDSEVSFDADGEIDTTSVEEEDWIDGKDGKRQDSMLEQDSRKK